MEDTARDFMPGPEFPKPIPPADDLGISWREHKDVEDAYNQAKDAHGIFEHGGGGVGKGVGDGVGGGATGEPIGGETPPIDIAALVAAVKANPALLLEHPELTELLGGGSRREALGPVEMLRRADTPDKLRVAVRNFWELAFDFSEVNDALAQQEFHTMIGRMHSYKLQGDPKKRPMTRERAERYGYAFNPDSTPEKRKEMFETYERMVFEWVSNQTLQQQFQTKDSIGADIKTRMFNWFIASQRPEMQAWMYKSIFTADATEEGFQSHGKLIDRAMRTYIAAYRGELRAHGIHVPTEHDLYGSTDEKLKNWIRDNRAGGDRGAVLKAEATLRNWDVDVKFAAHGGSIANPFVKALVTQIGRVPDGDDRGEVADERFLAPGYVELCRSRKDGRQKLKLETGADIANDTAKAAWLGLRQMNEYIGGDDDAKENQNAVAAQATLGCFPNLTASFLDLMPIKDERGAYKTLWQAWQGIGGPALDMDQIPWDEIKKVRDTATVAGMSEAEVADLFKTKTEGMARRGERGVYELQKFYAQQVFDSIMVKNMAESGAKITDPNFLVDLNKAYNLCFYFLWRNSGIDMKTAYKLKQLAKVNMLAGIAVANTSHDKKVETIIDDLKTSMVDGDTLAKHANMELYLNQIEAAAAESGFLSFRPHLQAKARDKNAKTQYEKEWELVKHIIEKRRLGAKPSLLSRNKEWFMNWFDDDEIAAINKAGLFAPFKC